MIAQVVKTSTYINEHTPGTAQVGVPLKIKTKQIFLNM